MSGPFTFASTVTLLGGGELPSGALEQALARSPRLVAVDGGADRALVAGVVPELVIGDLDSISDAARARMAGRLVELPGQDDTDFDKTLDRVQAPILLALGFAGGRLDHSLAALSALMRRPDRRGGVLSTPDLCVLTPPRLVLDPPAGRRPSLYPPALPGCPSAGLVWPTDGLRLEPGGRLGTSNRVAGDGPVRLEPDRPGLLCLVLVAGLDALLAGLSAAPAWPGPARAR